MKKIVAWSGGCDSTVVLHMLAKTASEESPVHAISVVSDVMGEGKMVAEKMARTLLLKRLNNPNIKYHEVEVKLSGDHFGLGGVGLPQPAFWLGCVLPYVENDSELYFGYVKEDCFWHYRHGFDAVVDGMAKLNGINLTMKYPIEWYEKKEVVSYLKDAGIYSDCWWCESPIRVTNGLGYQTCKKCGPCVIHQSSLKSDGEVKFLLGDAEVKRSEEEKVLA